MGGGEQLGCRLWLQGPSHNDRRMARRLSLPPCGREEIHLAARARPAQAEARSPARLGSLVRPGRLMSFVENAEPDRKNY